jgi:hypothetical protein
MNSRTFEAFKSVDIRTQTNVILCKRLEVYFKIRRETFWSSGVMISSSKQFIYFKECLSVFVICSILAMKVGFSFLAAES